LVITSNLVYTLRERHNNSEWLVITMNRLS